MQQNTSQEAKTLLTINGIFSFALSLGGVFLQVFLFTLGGFLAVVEYNLISACVIVIFYIISGWLLVRVVLKNLLLVGIGAHVLLFSLLFVFREQSLALLGVLGVIHGMAVGLYWGAMTPLQYVATTDQTRHQFFGKQHFLFSITGGIAPILGGMIIALVGSLVSKKFGYSFLFFLVAILMLGLYREVKKLPEYKRIDFSFIDVVKHKRDRMWKLALVHDVCYGLFDFMFTAFSAVIIFLIVKEEFLLGIMNGAGAIIAACAGLGASMILGKKQISLMSIGLIAAVGIGVFAWLENWWGLIVLTFLFNAMMPLLGVASSKMLFDMLDRSEQKWQKKYHLFLEREMALGAGRIISLLVFFLMVNDYNQLKIARTSLELLALLPLCIGGILTHITKVRD